MFIMIWLLEVQLVARLQNKDAIVESFSIEKLQRKAKKVGNDSIKQRSINYPTKSQFYNLHQFIYYAVQRQIRCVNKVSLQTCAL